MKASRIVWFGLVLYFDYVHYRTLDCGEYVTVDDHIHVDVDEVALDPYVDLGGQLAVAVAAVVQPPKVCIQQEVVNIPVERVEELNQLVMNHQR